MPKKKIVWESSINDLAEVATVTSRNDPETTVSIELAKLGALRIIAEELRELNRILITGDATINV